MRSRRTLATVAAVAAAMSVLGPARAAVAATPTDLFISEYVEGSANNKALELFNGTGSAIDLAAGGYGLQLYFNGATAPSTTIPLTGTVAAGDVFVLAASTADARILAQADLTTPASLFNGDDAIVLKHGDAAVDSIGQVGVDPGTEWGTGLTSTADNTLRRKAAVTGGDTQLTDAFDPAAQWDGYPTDTFDGLGAHGTGGDQPAVLTCGGVLTTAKGTAATRTVTAVDPDDTVTDLAVSAVTPAAAIIRTAVTPATAPGGTTSATVTVPADVAAGSYTVTMTSTDADRTAATCTFTVDVTTVRTVGEVEGPTPDAEDGRADRSPFAPASGNATSASLYDVRGATTEKTLARTDTGNPQYGFFLQSRLGATDNDPASSD